MKRYIARRVPRGRPVLAAAGSRSGRGSRGGRRRSGAGADLFSNKSRKMATKKRKPACFQSHTGIYSGFL